MTGNPVGLVEFLTQRLDERRHEAEAAATNDGHWRVGSTWNGATVECDGWSVAAGLRRTDAEFIGANNPAYVLQDIAAKRRIIQLHGPMSVLPGNEWFNDAHLTSEPMRLCRSCEPEKMFRRTHSFPCRTLKGLAAPFSSHPDWQPEWSVE